MADSMNVTNNRPKIDVAKFKKMTPQEIIKEESKGEEVPSEIITWAQEMAAFAKIPDNVTYEKVDGDVGLEALDKLGIEDAPPVGAENGNAEQPTKVEDPAAVKDPAATEETGDDTPDENMTGTVPGQAADKPKSKSENEEKAPEDELSLADSTLSTDLEEIRKRKMKKGIEN